MINKKAKILFAEDEETLREILATLLRNAGYDVETVADGADAIRAIQKGSYDAAILDIGMPRVGGLEVIEFIVSNYPNTRIIVLTGRADRKTEIEGLLLGVDAYLSKPTTSGEVSAAIEKCLTLSSEELARNRNLELVPLLLLQLRQYEKICEEQSNQLRAVQEGANRSEGILIGSDFMRLTKLVAATSHDLKGELLHIAESTKELRELGTGSKEIQEECDIIDRSVEYGQLILRRVFDLTAMGKTSLEDVDPAELVKRVERMVRPRLPSTVHLEVDVAKENTPVHIFANPEQLLGVILGLIQNAADVLRDSGGVIRLQSRVIENKFSIAVIDNGPGIPSEMIETLLKKQVPSKKGLGLGLYLHSHVVKEFGGELSFTSNPDTGTSFTVVLPLKTPS